MSSVQVPEQGPSAWRLRFWTIFMGQALSQLGSGVSQFVLVWWITETTGSVAAVATAGIVGLLPQALLSPLGGVLADRVSRRLVMVVADTCSALCIVIVMGLFFVGALELWHVYALMAVRSAMQACQVPAAGASMATLVPREFLPRASGLNQTLQGVTAIAAAPLGAMAVGALPLGWALAIDVVTAVVAVAALLCFRFPPAERVEGRADTFMRTLAGGFLFIWNDRGLRTLYVLLAGVMLLVMPAFTLVPLLVKDHFGQGAGHLAAVQGALGVGMVAGGVWMTAMAPRRQLPFILGGFGGAAVGVMGIALTPPHLSELAPLWWALTGFAFVAGNTPLVTLLQLLVPNGIQGRAFALLSALAGLAAPAGLAIATPVGNAVGVGHLFVGAGLLGVLACVAAVGSPALRALSSSEVRDVEPAQATL